MDDFAAPFDHFYWVVPGKLAAGCYPGAPEPVVAKLKLTVLIEAGIRHVINLMEQGETDHGGRPFVPYENLMTDLAADQNAAITFDRFSIRDCDIPTGINMNRILNQIDASIQARKPVYVHCWGGRGRTGTVVGCWMVRHRLVDSSDAVDRIQHLRRNTFNGGQPSPETPAQLEMVKAWS